MNLLWFIYLHPIGLPLTLCDWLNWFMSIEDTKEKIETCRRGYNGFRPHSTPDDLTSDEFAQKSRRRVA